MGKLGKRTCRAGVCVGWGRAFQDTCHQIPFQLEKSKVEGVAHGDTVSPSPGP